MTEIKKILDINKPQKVSYCIPLWLRDEQVRINTVAIKGRIQPNYDLRTEPIAIVCYGPSLKDTWSQISQFKYIMTCSGAHKFLIEHGIIPTWHTEVDPRPHKIKLVGTPHKDVEYLIASACHPEYFKHLENYNVKLWHIFDPNDEPMRTLPRGEWALTGGCGAGLRAMALARFMGFKEQHIFGMDGNYGSEEKTGSHASDHPNQAPPACVVEYDGKTFHTTPAFAEAARQTWHELDALADITVKFYGEGLVQVMSKNYVRKPAAPGTSLLAFNKPELISTDFRELNTRLHKEKLEYGVAGGKYADTIIRLVQILKKKVENGIPSVLDYGCGKGYLAKALPFPIWEYDPAIPGKDESPHAADLVVCTDVLEHIEPEKLLFVLDDLLRCTKQVGFFAIHTGPAHKTYADGRNTHLIQQGQDWWENKLSDFFKVAKIVQKGATLLVSVAPAKNRKLLVPQAKIEIWGEEANNVVAK